LLDVQSLAERAQAQTGLLREVTNTHAAAREIQRVKKAMARQAQRMQTT
jgi:hypothetical protein